VSLSAVKVCEIFASIQGEGLRVGEPSVFLRLSGCNLKCVMCDTRYSWNEGKELSYDEILERIASFGLKSVVITGGEPLLQRKSLLGLVKLLNENGFTLSIETNGTIADEPAVEVCKLMELVTISPKITSFSGKVLHLNTVCKLLEELKNRVCLKWPILSREDFEVVAELVEDMDVGGDVPVVVQPAFVPGESFDDYLERVRLLWKAAPEVFRKRRLSFRFIPQLHRLVFFDIERGV